MKCLKDLVGKRVDQVLTDGDNPGTVHLQFKCGDDYLTLYTDGDCCSNSWIEHVNGLQFLLGEVVNKVVDREIPDPDDGKPYDDCGNVIQYYGWTLETNKGRCDIEMRNESNGCYGGSLETHAYVTCKPLTQDF